MIRFERASFAYRPGAEAEEAGKVGDAGKAGVRDVSLEVRPGEVVVLCGRSGCGKSTILRLLAGLEQPVEGRVTVDSKQVTGPSPLRALAFQDSTLLPWRTVRDNVALGPEARNRRERDQRRVEAALQIVGLRDFAEAYPATLSGGMAQRASLARALVNRPRLFLLDEPFAGVDKPSEALITGLLRELAAEGATMLVATHDLSGLPSLCDEVLLLQREVVFHGSVAEALEPEVLGRAFGLVSPASDGASGDPPPRAMTSAPAMTRPPAGAKNPTAERTPAAAYASEAAREEADHA